MLGVELFALAKNSTTEKGNTTNNTPESTVKTIVLVHGGFVDGSGWEEVYKSSRKTAIP